MKEDLEDKEEKKQPVRKPVPVYKGIVLKVFKVRGKTYNPGDVYETKDKFSRDHLINIKKLKKDGNI